jgi:hypothetical protein
VVLVDEPAGWVAFFCTDVSASVADILSAVADRFSLEIALRDRKEIVGAGQQQIRAVLRPGVTEEQDSSCHGGKAAQPDCRA